MKASVVTVAHEIRFFPSVLEAVYFRAASALPLPLKFTVDRVQRFLHGGTHI